MKCVKLAKTSPPTVLKDVAGIEIMPAQSAFERFVKEAEDRTVLERLLSSNLSLLDVQGLRSVGNKVATLGSSAVVYCDKDNGLLSAVLAAYNNHWKLRTAPDDWWFCVIKRVAVAIDRHAGKEVVRRMFVEHEGKKELCVDVPTTSIYDVDYNLFFDQMSSEISKNVKVPKYVDTVTADFSITTPAMKIASQISIMSSLQEFFDYTMTTCCGIPAIEMLGTENDWIQLEEKLKSLKEALSPISSEIGLTCAWWSCAEKVFKKLLKTFQGSPDKKWWDKIIHYEGAHFSGETCGYVGWLTEFIEGTAKKIPPQNFTSGLLTVPLKIQSLDGAVDKAALVAGMLGFTLYEEIVPIVQPFQGWSLLLPEDSLFRSKSAA